MRYIYLYSVSAVMLAVLYGALTLLAGGAAGVVAAPAASNASQQARATLASALAGVIMSAPLWFIHWRWAVQEQARWSREPGHTVLRAFHRFYLYSVVCLSLMALLIAGGITVAQLARVALAARVSYPADDWARGIAAAVQSAALWAYHWRLIERAESAPNPASQPPT